MAILGLAPTANVLRAQATQPGHWESVRVHSGTHANPAPVEGVVWRDFVTVPQGTPWMRLYFTNAQLGKGSYLRLASLADGKVTKMTHDTVAQWGNSTAYFNGNSVLVEMVAGPNSEKNVVEIDKVLAGDPGSIAPPDPTFGFAGVDGGNDECATAIPVVAGANGPFSNVGATTTSAFPCGFNVQFDEWFVFFSCGGAYTFSTCNAARTFDTVLEVFSGGCGGLTSVGCNDDGGGTCGLGSSLTVALAVGLHYVRIGGYNGQSGTYQLDITNPCSPSDECTGATGLVDGVNGPFSTAAASTSFPTWPCAAGGRDIWFTHPVFCNNSINFTTCTGARTYDTCLEAFSGSCGGLTSLGCNDDAGGACGLGSSLTITNPPSGTMYVRLGGFNSASGSAEIVVSHAVSNDECATALAVGNGFNGPFCNDGANTSFAWPCAGGGADMWFSYTASHTGNAVFTTCTAARTFDTCIEVFSGACGGLTSLGCNDDTGGGCGFGSTLTIAVTSGTTYFIRIGGFFGSQGSCELLIGGTVANDHCQTAIPVSLGVNGLFTNINSTTSAPTWTCGGGACDVWFSFTANCTAPHIFTTCTPNRTVDTVLRVFDACGGTLLGCNDDSPLGCGVGVPPTGFASLLTVNCTAGLTYMVNVGGFGGATGNFDLRIETGTGTGTLSSPCGGCGPVTINVTGSPNIGGTLTAGIGGVGGGLPFVGIGFGPFCTPFCGPCLLGHNWQVALFGASAALGIPCNPVFIGAQVGFQGAGFITPGGCAAPLISLSPTVVATIG